MAMVVYFDHIIQISLSVILTEMAKTNSSGMTHGQPCSNGPERAGIGHGRITAPQDIPFTRLKTDSMPEILTGMEQTNYWDVIYPMAGLPFFNTLTVIGSGAIGLTWDWKL